MLAYKFIVDSGELSTDIFRLKEFKPTSPKELLEINTHIKYSLKQPPLFIIWFDAPLKFPQKASNTSWLKLFQAKVTYFPMSQKTMLIDETGEVLTYIWTVNHSIPLNTKIMPVCFVIAKSPLTRW